MPDKPSMFVAMSYDPADQKINEKIIRLVLKRDFEIVPANLLNSQPPQVNVPNMIRDADIFAAIATKRFEIAGTKEGKPSDWLLQEIGMAAAFSKPCLVFEEKGVRVEGVAQYITTIGEPFDRENIDEQLESYIQRIAFEARKLKQDKITKVEGWFDTRAVIQEIFENAHRYVHGVVEDFSSIDKFEGSLARLSKEVDFLLICSAYAPDVVRLENQLKLIKCNTQSIRYISPSKIGRIRMLFNETVGLFVIHGGGDNYFGIKIKPVDDLEKHFRDLEKESSPDIESARIEGKYCEATRSILSGSVKWAIERIHDFEKKDRFLYILSSRFTLFVTDEEVQKAIIKLARRGGCKIMFVLSEKSLDKGNYLQSISEIIKEKLGGFSNVSIRVLKKDYPLGRHRMIITNKIALDILDFDKDGYYYSTIQDQKHINMLKEDFAKLPAEKIK
jgi:hypothetical protein